MGRKLQAWQQKGLAPLSAALLGVEQDPLCGLILQDVTLLEEAD